MPSFGLYHHSPSSLSLHRSPLEGRVFPGDIINLSGNNGARPDAHALSAAFHASAHLVLTVETPTLLAHASSVFLLPSAHDDLGIQVDKDPETGRARVVGLAPGSVAATKVGRDSLAPGDLIVAVSEAGTLYDVPTAKEAAARLKVTGGGTTELRVVRPQAQALRSARSPASRPTSARPMGAEYAPQPAFDIFAPPPAYQAAV